jgi:hypothetical protein
MYTQKKFNIKTGRRIKYLIMLGCHKILILELFQLNGALPIEEKALGFMINPFDSVMNSLKINQPN